MPGRVSAYAKAAVERHEEGLTSVSLPRQQNPFASDEQEVPMGHWKLAANGRVWQRVHPKNDTNQAATPVVKRANRLRVQLHLHSVASEASHPLRPTVNHEEGGAGLADLLT
jgi:hypothetical protein